MKDDKKLDEYIDRYYEGTLQSENPDEVEINEALSYMSKLDNLDNEDIIKIDIDKIIDKGHEERNNKILKIKTVKFGVFAVLVAVLMGYCSMHFDVKYIVIFQGITIAILLLLNLILTKMDAVKGEV